MRKKYKFDSYEELEKVASMLERHGFDITYYECDPEKSCVCECSRSEDGGFLFPFPFRTGRYRTYVLVYRENCQKKCSFPAKTSKKDG